MSNQNPASTQNPEWDKPAGFPVQEQTTPLVCACCGSPITAKPEHMTQLDDHTYALKNAPRIRLRGKLDSLNAFVLLIASRFAGVSPLLNRHLSSLAAYVREILSAEYHNRRPEPIALAGFDEQQIHDATHDPLGVLGIAHLAPQAHDPELLHWLNYLRAQVREAEVMAVDCYPPVMGRGPDSREVAETPVQAINRLSSAVYLLELLLVRGDYGARTL